MSGAEYAGASIVIGMQMLQAWLSARRGKKAEDQAALRGHNAETAAAEAKSTLAETSQNQAAAVLEVKDALVESGAKTDQKLDVIHDFVNSINRKIKVRSRLRMRCLDRVRARRSRTRKAD